jgi:hypothetical protein
MQLIKSIVFVFGASVCAGLLGAGGGFLVGRFFPSYYAATFSSVARGGADPVEVGVGCGLGQGLTLGAVLGVALVLIHVWGASRSAARKELEELRREVRELSRMVMLARTAERPFSAASPSPTQILASEP